MTNEQKYLEVFGMPVDPSMCPTKECDECPCRPCAGGMSYEWWNKEYKGVNNG